MANSIRTPKLGVTAMSRRIAQAVDDEAWQKVRLSLKGKSTARKLEMLREYHTALFHTCNEVVGSTCCDIKDCDICIRVDNYIKALCRGGQLLPKESLRRALETNFNLEVVR